MGGSALPLEDRPMGDGLGLKTLIGALDKCERFGVIDVNRGVYVFDDSRPEIKSLEPGERCTKSWLTKGSLR